MEKPGALEKLYRANQQRPWVFVEPGGNFGDLLIYQGAYELANRCRLDYQVIDYEAFLNTEISPETAVYLQGGGGYNPYNSGKVFRLLEHALSVEHPCVVQGPCTVDQDGAVLQRLAAIVRLPPV